MSVATAYATWLQGAVGHLIEVQADVSSGVVGTTVVGRADVAIQKLSSLRRTVILRESSRFSTYSSVRVVSEK